MFESDLPTLISVLQKARSTPAYLERTLVSCFLFVIDNIIEVCSLYKRLPLIKVVKLFSSHSPNKVQNNIYVFCQEKAAKWCELIQH